MQLHDLNSSPAELDLTLLDLGPLAWVLEELRKSLEGATKALKRFMREAEASRDSDLAALDAASCAPPVSSCTRRWARWRWWA
jgi:chemosensory pili system protein ChpA (sensor histidine kinase/response regulator)